MLVAISTFSRNSEFTSCNFDFSLHFKIFLGILTLVEFCRISFVFCQNMNLRLAISTFFSEFYVYTSQF